MLYNEHNKAGKDLQRRITKLREEGKDPSLAQRPPTPPRSHTSSSPGPHPLSSHISRGRMVDSNHTIDDSYMVLGQQVRYIRLFFFLIHADLSEVGPDGHV
jgi:hypothetical protein